MLLVLDFSVCLFMGVEDVEERAKRDTDTEI
jgi:hypothetical protein